LDEFRVYYIPDEYVEEILILGDMLKTEPNSLINRYRLFKRIDKIIPEVACYKEKTLDCANALNPCVTVKVLGV